MAKHRLDDRVREHGHWPNGNHWCPCCGKWIDYGDGKLTYDGFELHKQCS